MKIQLGREFKDGALGKNLHIYLDRPPYGGLNGEGEGLRLSILANSGGGKSHAMAVIAEEAHEKRIPFIFYDKNGNATSLKQLGEDVIVIGKKTKRNQTAHYDLQSVLTNPHQYIDLMLDKGFNIVVDLSGNTIDNRAWALAKLMNAHYELAEENPTPAFIFIDEAHEFAPQGRCSEGQKQSLAIMELFVSDGRKRGGLFVTATQRLTFLNKNVLFGMNLKMFGKIYHPPDFQYIKPNLPHNIAFHHMASLPQGRFYVVNQAIYKPRLLHVKQRRTEDLGVTPVIKQRTGPRPKIGQMSFFTTDLQINQPKQL